ncbi:hypothetical protein P7K49_004114 [Saguinus oedipus]|uniref:EGF-like domain-containing protein n=1 Tax=Saguinus oedipus TaxID=9490 RepID=A0ABQ9W6G6_SAGOE|nr:hypothetical protein P7K49_004114 [Saguinus oedipus]
MAVFAAGLYQRRRDEGRNWASMCLNVARSSWRATAPRPVGCWQTPKAPLLPVTRQWPQSPSRSESWAQDLREMAQDPREQEELRCQVLSWYAILCQEAGAALAGWRDHTLCAMECPAGTMYQSCMTPCPASCAHLTDPVDCEGPCVEGCASIPGYAYSGTQSLPLADCGCTGNGIYYQVRAGSGRPRGAELGDVFVTEDCSERCTCASSRILLCEPFSCGEGEVCTLGNHTRGCFPESPCLQNPCQNDGQCREQGATFTCRCDVGYGGDLCTEPRDVPPPRKPGEGIQRPVPSQPVNLSARPTATTE